VAEKQQQQQQQQQQEQHMVSNSVSGAGWHARVGWL
jgi:hypothetical protein